MTGDPYEEADQQQAAEAKLVMPTPATKSRKIVFLGLAMAGLIMAMVILANVAGLVTAKRSSEAHPLPKPTTMTHQQSDNFASQQSSEAAYLQGADRDKASRNAEDTVLGQAKDLGDPYAEADGVPKKAAAQEAAEQGRGGPHGGGAKSDAELQRERLIAEEQHRRQNDLDSTPVALDFSDYFDKEKPAAVVSENNPAAPGTPVATAEPEAAQTAPHRGRLTELISEEREREGGETDASEKRQPHDPKDDYSFDASFGKLYRLMEDTIIETVLVNRLAGASVGPVIVMVTTDVYSESGSHLLIPQGTRLLGTVGSVGSVNQERLFVAFHRMIMPDGYSVSLDKFKGLDVVGQTGLRDLVNHRYVQIFGASLALAAVAATTQIGNNTNFTNLNWGSEMRNSASEGLGQSAQRVMERFLNVLPTFTIRERARVKVMLAGDLLLPDTKNHTMDPDL
jgi:type IV secretory pathway VirB10-like protein